MKNEKIAEKKKIPSVLMMPHVVVHWTTHPKDLGSIPAWSIASQHSFLSPAAVAAQQWSGSLLIKRQGD